MSDKLKHKILFVLVDTVGLLVLFSSILISLVVLGSFLVWDTWVLELLWAMKLIILRILIALSFVLAFYGGWKSDYRG